MSPASPGSALQIATTGGTCVIATAPGSVSDEGDTRVICQWQVGKKIPGVSCKAGGPWLAHGKRGNLLCKNWKGRGREEKPR